jgi:hypothetical protein
MVAPGIMLLVISAAIDLNDACGTSLGSNPSYVPFMGNENNQYIHNNQ